MTQIPEDLSEKGKFLASKYFPIEHRPDAELDIALALLEERTKWEKELSVLRSNGVALILETLKTEHQEILEALKNIADGGYFNPDKMRSMCKNLYDKYAGRK